MTEAGKVGTYSRREFECPTYSEVEKQGDHQNDEDIDQWIPFTEYCIKMNALGHRGDENHMKVSRQHCLGICSVCVSVCLSMCVHVCC